MKNILILVSLTLALTLSGCGSAAPPPAAPMEAAAPATMADSEASYDAEVSGGGYESAAIPAATETRKVVYSAEYRLETEDFAGTIQRLEQKMAVSGSYIQQSDSRAATEHSPAYASLNIRVPAAMYGDFNTFLNNLALTVSSNKHGEDVTAQYFDTEARLKVLQAQEARILTFIANSQDLDEIFKIERELTRISTEIEQLTTVRNRLDNLTAYATVYVEIYETSPDDAALMEQDTFGARVQQAMEGSVKALVALAQGLVVVLIWIWPLLVIAVLVVLIWRKLHSRKQRGRNMGCDTEASPILPPQEHDKN